MHLEAMLLYNSQSLLRVMLQVSGSVLFKRSSFLYSCLVVLVTLGLQLLKEQQGLEDFHFMDPSGVAALFVGVNLAVLFRLHLAWGRYWLVCTKGDEMYSKWRGAFSQYCTFVNLTIQESIAKNNKRSADKVNRLKFFKAKVESYFVLMSAMASESLQNGECRRAEQTRSWSGSVVLKESVLPKPRTQLPQLEIGQGQKAAGSQVYRVRTQPSTRMMDELGACAERTEMVMSWIESCFAKTQPDLSVAPPIQFRMYQELTNGIAAFSAMRVISDTPIPLPYAQLTIALQILLAVASIAQVTSSMSSSYVWAPLSALLFLLIPWLLMELAVAIENPLRSSANKLCSFQSHERFSDALSAISKCNYFEIDDQPRGTETAKAIRKVRVSSGASGTTQESENVLTPSGNFDPHWGCENDITDFTQSGGFNSHWEYDHDMTPTWHDEQSTTWEYEPDLPINRHLASISSHMERQLNILTAELAVLQNLSGPEGAGVLHLPPPSPNDLPAERVPEAVADAQGYDPSGRGSRSSWGSQNSRRRLAASRGNSFERTGTDEMYCSDAVEMKI